VKRWGVLGAVFITVLLAAAMVSACGSDPERAYTEKVLSINERMIEIVDRFNASQSAEDVIDYSALYAEVKSIQPPADLADAHQLLLKAMETEQQAFELYAVSGWTEYVNLHDQVIETMNTYWSELRARDLVQ
jgi:hypothetical protein